MVLPPSLVATYPEVYVRGLLDSGLGLPCWEPAPHDVDPERRGVIPGDVGIYTIDRSSKKLFNLWESEGAIRILAALYSCGPYKPMQGQITREPILNPGETIITGASVDSPVAAPHLNE